MSRDFDLRRAVPPAAGADSAVAFRLEPEAVGALHLFGREGNGVRHASLDAQRQQARGRRVVGIARLDRTLAADDQRLAVEGCRHRGRDLRDEAGGVFEQGGDRLVDACLRPARRRERPDRPFTGRDPRQRHGVGSGIEQGTARAIGPQADIRRIDQRVAVGRHDAEAECRRHGLHLADFSAREQQRRSVCGCDM